LENPEIWIARPIERRKYVAAAADAGFDRQLFAVGRRRCWHFQAAPLPGLMMATATAANALARAPCFAFRIVDHRRPVTLERIVGGFTVKLRRARCPVDHRLVAIAEPVNQAIRLIRGVADCRLGAGQSIAAGGIISQIIVGSAGRRPAVDDPGERSGDVGQCFSMTGGLGRPGRE
jgi:hypothetical protein